ncbi:MAG: flagellar basal body P-ring protein FlgI [Armatimonadetes bacterium]|nr:flagellar basal body P-ring protein FlgI [Armatimonadota bacterium]
MNLKRTFSTALLPALVSLSAWGQAPASNPAAKPPASATDTAAKKVAPPVRLSGDQVEREGIEVRIKDIARFRGVRGNQLLGYGLVVGLAGTGDSNKTPFTATLLSNAMKKFGTLVDPKGLQAKNIAAVAVTAELPPFATPGNSIEITVQSIGDAKSLYGGTLLQTPLYGQSDEEHAVVVAQGPISVGGASASGGGSSATKNHVNAGKIPSGGIVERAVPFQMVFEGNKLYLELDDADLTTSQRIAEALTKRFPNYVATAVDGGTIEIAVPTDASPVKAMSEIESATVFADIPALVIVDERTGTIVVGGNVKIGPALITRGSMKVSIARYPVISQPAPLSNGQTVVDSEYDVAIEEDQAKVGQLPAYATLADLAKLFDALQVSAQDVIAILQALKEQGALKARVKMR